MWHKINNSILLVFMATVLKAEPLVIYDSGNTKLFQSLPKIIRYQFAGPENYQAEFNGLPVVTHSMTPGRVQTRTINRPFLNQPIFIVGADALSLTWLKEHRQQLKKHNATGIAVNVKTQKELEKMVQASGGLAINPVAGDKISRQLSLKHYPALISATRIEQ
ncbi:MAG: hypothetical protein DRQ62_11705 [Gammaproteobacteria bacterium]|nr:MAG: hypothetical protein DRQ62_11705 [Gammaproteobacteria bacterium]